MCPISRRYVMSNIECPTRKLDHFGIVAGICRLISLVETIDSLIDAPNRKVSVGEATSVMVLNALGFASRPLYLTPEFFKNKSADLLIRENLCADDFNDDSLGRALDALYDAGLTETYAKVASSALSAFGISYRFVHPDSSSFSQHGQYESKSSAPEAVRITRGYSKDHRPDLKQAVPALMCAHKYRFPVWLEALDGNSSDKTTFPKIIQNYTAHFTDSQSPYFITDSAGYTEDNIQERSGNIKQVSRPPAAIKTVRSLYQQIEPECMESASQPGYAYAEVGCIYGGINQRRLVVYSEKAYRREIKTLNWRI